VIKCIFTLHFAGRDLLTPTHNTTLVELLRDNNSGGDRDIETSTDKTLHGHAAVAREWLQCTGLLLSRYAASSRITAFRRQTEQASGTSAQPLVSYRPARVTRSATQALDSGCRVGPWPAGSVSNESTTYANNAASA